MRRSVGAGVLICLTAPLLAGCQDPLELAGRLGSVAMDEPGMLVPEGLPGVATRADVAEVVFRSLSDDSPTTEFLSLLATESDRRWALFHDRTERWKRDDHYPATGIRRESATWVDGMVKAHAQSRAAVRDWAENVLRIEVRVAENDEREAARELATAKESARRARTRVPPGTPPDDAARTRANEAEAAARLEDERVREKEAAAARASSTLNGLRSIRFEWTAVKYAGLDDDDSRQETAADGFDHAVVAFRLTFREQTSRIHVSGCERLERGWVARELEFDASERRQAGGK